MKPAAPPGAPQTSLFRCIFTGQALWISLALIIACVFIYAGVRTHDFVDWDDPAYVSENLHVANGLTSDAVRWAFTTGHMGNWHPLTWLTYLIGIQLFGNQAGSHALMNVLLHILATLALFGLLHRITGARGRSGFVAALFAVHPLHVESVAWVSERKDVLSALLGFLALWAYAGYVRDRTPRRYLTVAFLFVLGLMAKPMLVTLPLMMLLLDYWPLHRMSFNGPKTAASTPMQLLTEKLPLFFIAAIFSVITVIAQRAGGAVAELTKLPLGGRIANAIVAYAAYLGKMLWPVNLSPLYPLYSWPAGIVAGCAFVWIVISLAVLAGARRYPYLAMGWLWYVVTLLPVIGLVQVGSQSMADRYTYIPLVGIFIALTWGACDLLASVPSAKSLLPIAAAASILAFAIVAHAQTGYWSGSKALWGHAVDVDGNNSVAQRLLGDTFSKEGKREEAIQHYSAALRVKPDNAEAHIGMGLALSEQGKYADAIAHYHEALRLNPNLVDAHHDLGLALANHGRTAEAIQEYSAALKIDPLFLKAHLNIGAALASLGRPDEAIQHFSEVLRLAPDSPDAHNNLGIVLAGQGRRAEAIQHFSAALRLKPDFALARQNLNIALSQNGGNGAVSTH